MTDINDIPVETVIVDPKPSGIKSKVGSDEFKLQFLDIVRKGPLWRTSSKMAEMLNCDLDDLVRWMDIQPGLVRRPGKNDGDVYYAMADRCEQAKEEKEKVPGMEKKQVMEEDRYSIAQLHLIYDQTVFVLDKYAYHMNKRNAEAFAKLVEAREALSAGICLFANTLKIDMNKLPKR